MQKSFLITFFSRVLQGLFAIFTTVIIARIFGPSGQGTYSFLREYLSIFVVIFDLGVPVAIIYFAGQKKFSSSLLIKNSIILSFLNGFLGIIFTGLLYYFFQRSIFKGIEFNILLWTIFSLPFLLLYSSLSSLLLGLTKINTYNKLNVTFSLVSFISIGILSFLVYKIKIVFIAILSSLIFTSGLTFIYFIKTKLVTKGGFKIIFSELIKWGVKGQIGNIFQYLNYRLDIFMINYFLGATALGIYSVAVVIVESIFLISKTMAVVLLSEVTNVKQQTDATIATLRASRLVFSLNFIICVLLGILSHWFIPFIYGHKFAASVIPFYFLLPGILIFSLTNILASYITGIGYPKYNSLIAGVSCIFTIGLYSLIIPKFGIKGAAIASSISYTFSTIMTIFYFKKLAKQPIRLKEFILLQKEDLKNLRLWNRK